MAVNGDLAKTSGSVISIHDISYTVQVGAGCCRSKDKIILNDIDGMFKPGMNAIMGPTGSGKTSLLDIIAGRKDPKGLEGQLLVDGNPQPKNFKCMTGYVVQDDVVMGTLSVRENFMFSANVRLPSSISKKEKAKRVEDTINELGLTHCADTKVGTEFIRGVSGGERKRTNIGMELIIAPSVLFLDEPTTGLDASTSYAVLHLLHRIARKGKTIIFSIHQPRYSIFKLFDNLMLLSRGKTVYHGAAEDALEFFNSIGHECEQHNNPADFFLDVVNGDSTAIQLIENSPSKEKPKDMIVSEGSITQVEVLNGSPGNNQVKPGVETHISIEEHVAEIGTSLAQQLSEDYKASKWHAEMIAEAQPIMDDYAARKKAGQAIIIEKAEYQTSFMTQLTHVSKRAFLNLIRNPMATVLQIILLSILAIIVGGLYYGLSDMVEPGIQNRVGMFFFMIMNQVFSNLSALELFIKERAIFIHENSSGFYRVSAYFIAKFFFDLLPMRIIPLTTFTLITYFMTGLAISAGQFFVLFVTLFAVSICATGVCFFFGAAVGVFAIANLLCVMTFVVMLIFGGLFVNIDSLWVGIRWLQYFSIFRYGLFALEINELKGLEFYNMDNGTKVSVGLAGERYLTQQGTPYDSDWDLWKNIMAIFLISVGYFIMCYIMLRRIKKLK